MSLDPELFRGASSVQILAQLLEDLFRLCKPAEREQRIAALSQQLAAIVGRRHIAGEGENVLGATFLSRNRHALIPLVGLRLVMLEARSADLTRIRRHELRQIAIHRAAFRCAIGRHRLAQCFTKARNLVGDLLFPKLRPA